MAIRVVLAKCEAVQMNIVMWLARLPIQPSCKEVYHMNIKLFSQRNSSVLMIR